MQSQEPTHSLDATDLPLPVMLLRLGRLMRHLDQGQVVEVRCGPDDQTLREVRAFCEVMRHELLDQGHRDGVVVHVIRRI